MSGLSVAALASPGEAQVTLDQFRPTPLAKDGFAVSRPEVLGHLEWSALAHVDYANDPLILKTNRSERELHVVADQLVLHVGGALGLGKRLTIFGMLPVNVLMEGRDRGRLAAAPDGPGIGDLALAGRLLLAGGPSKRGSLSAELIARVPTAELADRSQVYSGDKIGSYEPALLGELRFGNFDMRLRAGARFRKEIQVGDIVLGHELVYGFGARYRLVDGLYAHAELYGAMNLSDLGDAQHTPLELLAGAKYHASGWLIGAAAGPGLIEGYGSPDVRVVGSFGYAPIVRAKPVAKDSDGDGLLDANDRCPMRPEDKDAFEDGDGCPDLDDDKDGVLDERDACRLEPEDRDAFEDDNGCPDPDNDGDAILDANDGCPLEPEDKDGFQDADGCAEPDNDKDAMLDVDDACPADPGPRESKGCPGVRIDIEQGKLSILDRVEFETNKDVILAQSEPLLGEVEATLSANPQLERVRIEGHTDDVGKDAKNLDLSKRRARSVARWLVKHGISIERLEAFGCGETRPLGGNDTEEGRQQNRRVEFHILVPAPAALRGTEGCVQIPVK
jgi:outer membrane protein OmpA-like peptidoglycan-associated protein